MGLRLFFVPNFPGAMFIQWATFIPDSRVFKREQLSRDARKISGITMIQSYDIFIALP